MATGWLAGQAARDFTATDKSMLNNFDIEQSEEFKTTKYFCKTNFDMKKIKDLKGNPLLLFINAWSVGMTLDRNEGLILSEFGRD